MARFRPIVESKPLLWAVLAIPAAHIFYCYLSEDIWPGDLLPSTGTWSARLLVVALMLTPLSQLLRGRSWLQWLVRRRRAFGVAAFVYAALHLIFYLLDMETVGNMVAELGALSIWTGWVALLLMLPLALTSNDASVRALRSAWKRLHRLAYPAALLLLVHWIFVHDDRAEALITFAPLAALQVARLVRRVRSAAGQDRPAIQPLHTGD
jgi:methionine sulfoxide reductase heme-binding subunit